ncbi:hypothetical protein NUU61_009182 [Penicillium alfredii]|uniref:Major facilitator superfamily (MFS) profile domain-containing protein n=1 Tax=Penicillium alfredii TaxID=1506179 RepID=A0A9W9EML1_9EURO|nr:uncharacterized protein NUU61_009182 [Penicillium alfredii]KAJ5084603.1 hypothetical protein NUU61_009182 [Penicillium alfredii]
MASVLPQDVEKAPGELYMHERFSIGAGKPFPPPLPDAKHYVVEFDGIDDPMHPYNWKISIKLYISIMVCTGTLVVSFTSAVFAPAIDSASKAFGVGSEVGKLGTSLYVLGFACGPLIWAPASELRGRKWPLTIGMLGGGIFTIGSAVAKDIQTLIICRFFAGTFGASQLTVVPAVLADVFDNTYRGVAISLYALTVFIGPFSAPFIGGFIASSYLGWRWTLYIPAILSLVLGALCVVFLKETYAPCLLIVKAAAIRRQTHNWGVHAKQEEVEVNFRDLLNKYFTRPLKMLITEPILLLVSLYMSFIYGLVYALLEAYPYVFEQIHGMRPGVSGLTFFGLVIGQVLACTLIVSQHGIYARKLADNKNVPVPEWRLSPTLLGAPAFTIGLFWAASAVAANIILRSAVAAGFPLFSTQMFENMGVQWAGTLLGCLAAIMMPIPLAFRTYGPWLRTKSKIFQQLVL